jgi:hypothetical protein
MVRSSLAAAALVLCLAGTALAGPPWLITAYNVVRPNQPDAEPVLRGRVEGRAGGFYGGVRGRTLDSQPDDARFDLYLGLRPEFGALSVDVAYSREFGEAAGALALSVGRPLGPDARLTARVNLNATTETAFTEAGASLSLPRDYRIRGSVSSEFSTRDPDADPRLAINLGATRAITDSMTLNLGYRDANNTPGRAAVSLRVKF